MENLETILKNLSQTPSVLTIFIGDIPHEKWHQRRKPTKWTIHENACHLTVAEEMIFKRFQQFQKEEQPVFKPYLPDQTVKVDFSALDLIEQLGKFSKSRNDTMALLRTFDEHTWSRPAIHEEYETYNAAILARHTLMHDYFHMYRIEELWLTKDEYL